MKLIGFTGKMGAGKSTAAMMTGGKVLSLAKPMKECVKDLFLFSEYQMQTLAGKNAIDPRWGVSPRKVMQLFATDFIRKFFPDFWVKRLEMELGTVAYRTVAIDDIRFDNEAEFIRSRGGVIVHIKGREAKCEKVKDEDLTSFMRLVSWFVGVITWWKLKNHTSEKGVTFKPGDMIIDNSRSYSYLDGQVQEVLEGIKV